MAQLTDNLRVAVSRKRGELNMNVLQLSEQTGISRWTLDKILSGQRTSVRAGTIAKLNDWLYQQV